MFPGFRPVKIYEEQQKEQHRVRYILKAYWNNSESQRKAFGGYIIKILFGEHSDSFKNSHHVRIREANGKRSGQCNRTFSNFI